MSQASMTAIYVFCAPPDSPTSIHMHTQKRNKMARVQDRMTTPGSSQYPTQGQTPCPSLTELFGLLCFGHIWTYSVPPLGCEDVIENLGE